MVTDAERTEKMQHFFILCSSSDESRLDGDEGLRGACEEQCFGKFARNNVFNLKCQNPKTQKMEFRLLSRRGGGGGLKCILLVLNLRAIFCCF